MNFFNVGLIVAATQIIIALFFVGIAIFENYSEEGWFGLLLLILPYFYYKCFKFTYSNEEAKLRKELRLAELEKKLKELKK